MKLEEKKTYRTRNLQFTITVEKFGNETYPFIGTGGLLYKADGSYVDESVVSGLDLIEEVPGIEFHGAKK